MQNRLGILGIWEILRNWHRTEFRRHSGSFRLEYGIASSTRLVYRTFEGETDWPFANFLSNPATKAVTVTLAKNKKQKMCSFSRKSKGH